LLTRNTDTETLRYPIIHLIGDDIEVAMTHGQQYGEEYYSFVNGQHTTQGGTHQAAFREAVVKTIREFYKKEFDASDVRASIVSAISIRVQEPVFESQTKTKLGSQNIAPDGPSVRTFINDFIKKALDDYLHKHPADADSLLKRILQSERERKDIAGIKKLANERAKKASLHNKKLRDCKIHFEDSHERKQDTTLFITEGDSASGSITKSRDVMTQAVFSLKGKPVETHHCETFFVNFTILFLFFSTKMAVPINESAINTIVDKTKNISLFPWKMFTAPMNAKHTHVIFD
jgi:topoisomerase-4 subunit B